MSKPRRAPALMAFMALMILMAPVALEGAPARARSSECRATRDAYAALKHGMRYAEAVRILGCPGRPVTRMTIGETRRTTYAWRGTGTYGANLTLSFRNGHLTSKSQLGLR